MKATIAALVFSGAVLCTAPVLANPLTFSGRFDTPANAALVGSDLAPALFGNDNDIANNVALYTITVPTAQDVRFDSNGVAAGGADPYFTLFAGTGGGAAFAQSNYFQAFGSGGDFDDTYFLAAGDYTVAMGVFANMSLAEQYADPLVTLAEGFSGLGDPNWLGNYYYELVVTLEDGGTPVPEPGGLSLLAVAAAALVAAGHRRRPRPGAQRPTVSSSRGWMHVLAPLLLLLAAASSAPAQAQRAAPPDRPGTEARDAAADIFDSQMPVRLRVTGVLLHHGQGTGAGPGHQATISVNGEVARPFALGARVHQDLFLRRIADDRVLIANDDRTVVFDLPVDRPAGTSTATGAIGGPVTSVTQQARQQGAVVHPMTAGPASSEMSSTSQGQAEAQPRLAAEPAEPSGPSSAGSAGRAAPPETSGSAGAANQQRMQPSRP